MSPKKFWISLAATSIVIGGGAGFMIYTQADKNEAARAHVETIKGQIVKARKTIENTASLEREVIVLREMSEVIKQILPDSEDVNNLIHTLQEYSRESEVKVTSYKRKPDRARNAADFDKVSYTFTIEGDTFQFLTLLDKVETHGRFMSVPSFRMTAATRKSIEEEGIARHKISLEIETYKFEPPGQSKQVKIEAYDRKRDLLAGEINRRQQALTLRKYNYRGPRGRRDPWIDPRVPASVQDASSLGVQEQMDLVEELRQRMDGALEQWAEVDEAKNVLAAMVSRRDLEETLGLLEEDLRRLEADRVISYIPAQKRLKNDVYDPLEELRVKLTESQGVLGPNKEMLTQVADSMARHIEDGEFDLALDTFDTVRDGLDLVQGDPIREELVLVVRQHADDARTLRDFEKIELDIQGTAIIEGGPPAVVVNGRSLSIGDIVADELEILGIRPNEIDFYFRGVILTRLF